MKIALVGDHDESITAHQAIPQALQLAADTLSTKVDFVWLDSTDVDINELKNFTGVWCIPASPYVDTDNVLQAIRYVRENNVPFLGTCGGYQHAALEYARNQLGYSQADNAEINPEAAMPLISGLTCKLYDEKAAVSLHNDSMVAGLYGKTEIEEEYFCGFGVNRTYLNIFENSDMTFTGFDSDGDPRSLEIRKHRFFIGTAFQPERSALNGVAHPVVTAFLQATLTE